MLTKEAVPEPRFPFGKNWTRFLEVLSDERIETARESLRLMLGRERLDGVRFLDAGSGSGLFSLAARTLGARVHSFDFDPDSVRCTAELRRRYRPDDSDWTVESGSVLDEKYLESLGTFDIVYCWGVLHHTGQMWKGLELIHRRVGSGGTLFIMIYMDRGWKSSAWEIVKRTYNRGPAGKALVLLVTLPYFVLRGFLGDVARFRNPLSRYTEYGKQRGMSCFHDWIDWVGGYPFEVATRDEIVSFFQSRGFALEREEYQEYVLRNDG